MGLAKARDLFGFRSRFFKVIIGKTYTTCALASECSRSFVFESRNEKDMKRAYAAGGTPDYFAPELIASSGHTLAVDWWTLGVLAYELMCGSPPFESETPMQTYQKALKSSHSSCLA